jgi:hypothetical protein
VKKHEEALADAVALIAASPEASPLAQDPDAAGGAASDRLIDMEIHFDYA